jgi:multidrug efflux pump subunit AcrA (membrane-fusion protein)
MTKKRIFLILALLFLVAGCEQERVENTAVGEEPADSSADAVTVTPQPTLPPPGGATVLAEGELAAVNPVLSLAVEANGRLQQIHVQPGDRVEAGDVIAALDDDALQDAVTDAQLGVARAENSLAQAQLTLDDLLSWQPDETAVALAEANLAAAQVAYENAQSSDAAAANSLTAARVNLEQAQRNLAEAQEAYDTAFDPGREWEFGVPGRKERLEQEREAAERNLAFAEENLEVAQAEYNLALAGLNADTAVSANASLLNAQQALADATAGPKASEIDAARLQVEQAAIALEQAEFTLAQAEDALDNAEVTAPWAGTVLSVEVATGGMVSAGAPVVTLLDTEQLQFHTNNLSERDLAQIDVGQPAAVTLKAFPNDTLPGTVAGIAPQASGMVGDAAIFTVEIELAPTDLALRPGMTGRVEITDE